MVRRDTQLNYANMCENFEDNFNQQKCNGNINTSACTSDTSIYVESLLNVSRKKPRVWTNRSTLVPL
jgi:hypothetical protein